ncbi:MAG: cysteine peptidase family C39 domain-containing protein [Candidatus Tectomicrobia bacterium]|nr:cysteine peptidase family C39 domain-containing protein [Candidatus Tectomicrobia bacterium]
MIVWYAQEHLSSCVAACLRMVLTSFGQHHSESAIRGVLGNPRFGLTLKQAAVQLKIAGAMPQWHVDWGLDDIRDCLRDSVHPIVGVERRFFGHPSATHAVVIIAVRGSEVEILDPLVGPAPQMAHIATFATAWRSAGQEALVVRRPLPS